MGLNFEMKERIRKELSLEQRIELLDKALRKALAKVAEAEELALELELAVFDGPTNSTLVQKHYDALTDAENKVRLIEATLIRLRKKTGQIPPKPPEVLLP